MRSLILQIAWSAALFGAGCGSAETNTPPVTSAAEQPPKAKAPAIVETVDTRLTVSGPIIVEHQVDVTAQRDGLLSKILVDAPARVKSGTVLARLDDRQIAANLEAARAKSRSIAADLKNWEADLEVLKADRGRAQHLWDLGLISEEQLQHAKYKVESDQWDIKRVQETLNTAHQEERSLELEQEKMSITAPFDGLIARRYVREGQSVSKGDRLFWVTEESPLLMRFTLPERFFGRVRSAQQFEIVSPDVPGEKHAARVKEISPVVDPASGTFEVLVQLVGHRGSLRPGMTANIQVENPR
jgi:membrane fusion protein (multidrug efflux system)